MFATPVPDAPKNGKVKPRRAALARTLLVFGAAALLAFFVTRGLRPDAGERAPIREIASWSSARWRADTLGRVAADFSISGTVRDREGQPIAGATICASCASCAVVEQPALACTQSKVDGSYGLNVESKSALLVSASAPGFTAATANNGRPIPWSAKPQGGLDLTLQRGGVRVAGVVLDALGGPVASARVQLIAFDAGLRPTLETRSDDNGRFEFWTAPTSASLRAEAEGYAPALRNTVAPSQNIEIVLAPASTIRGRVTAHASHAPVAGVEIRAVPEAAQVRTGPALSQADGSFELTGLDPGRYTLTAESESWRGLGERTVELGLADVISDVVVQVIPAVSLVGHVILSERGNAPCERGYVALGPPNKLMRALTREAIPVDEASSEQALVPSLLSNIEADGSVRFKGLSPGRYQVVLQCPDHVLGEGPELLDVGTKNLEVKWRMTRGLALAVQVLDERNRPVPNAQMQLSISRAGGPANRAVMPLTADARGRASVPANLYPGTYTVEPTNGLRGPPVTTELREGAGETTLTLQVEGSAFISVEARDDAGEPLDGLRVVAKVQNMSAGNADSATDALASARGDGHYRIGPLPAGRYRVVAEDGVNPPHSADDSDNSLVRLLGGEDVAVQLRVVRGAQLEGLVVDERGEPQANVWVSARAESVNDVLQLEQSVQGTASRVLSDPDGKFTIERLTSAARYTVRASQPFRSAALLRDVAPGQAIKLIVPSPVSVAGAVVSASGAPADHPGVHAFHEQTSTARSAHVLSDGTFKVTGLPPGRITLTAVGAGDLSIQQELELAPGEQRSQVRLVLPATSPQSQPEAEPAQAAREPT